MTESAAILDYASPRKRGPFRLPATGTLTIEIHEDRVVVHQRLAGKGAAIAALGLGAVLTAALVAKTAEECLSDASGRRVAVPHWDEAVCPGVVIAAAFVVAIALTQQTWRQTHLTVEYNRMALSLISPLQRRRYEWTAVHVIDVNLALTANHETGDPLGEMLITRTAGGDVRLFTDHRATRLEPVVAAVRNVFQTGRPEPA